MLCGGLVRDTGLAVAARGPWFNADVRGSLHEDELPIDRQLVRSLVDRSCPEYSSLTIEELASTGSSNALFRLGHDLLVRLPRQAGGTMTIEKEARWLPLFAEALPVPVPEVLALGDPGFGYPERWSVVRWLDGVVPTFPTPHEHRLALARDLADLVTAIRAVPVPATLVGDPSVTWYRGRPLAERDAATVDAIGRCERIDGLDVDLDAARRTWRAAMQLGTPDAPSQPRWFHGDLFAENLLVRGDRLSAVLDFGGVGVGDPTVDLIVAWEVLDARGQAAFRAELEVDELTWLRARAWALSIAMVALPYYWRTMPARCAQKLAVVRAVLDSDGG